MTLPNPAPRSDLSASVPVESLRARFDAACLAIPPLAVLGSGEPLAVGCSGGGDSMALLDLAVHRSQRTGCAVHVLHFDHAQRPSSAEEATSVENHCAGRRVAFHSGRMSGAGDRQLDEGSLRDARYDFFRQTMKTLGAKVLLLAHHADDRAETLLMRLMRGSGPTGLTSIRPLEKVGGVTVARPLLDFRRAELRDYLRDRGIEWFEDPSNRDARFKRVWVRNELLPLMNDRMGFDITPRLLRAGSLIEEEAAALRSACELLLDQLAIPPAPPAMAALRLEHPLWTGAAPELRRALLRFWLWKIRRGGHPPGFDAVQEAVNFAERGAGRLRTVERLHLARQDGNLVAYPDPKSVARNSG